MARMPVLPPMACDEALLCQKRPVARSDRGCDAGTVPASDVTLAGAFLHGDFAVVKWAFGTKPPCGPAVKPDAGHRGRGGGVDGRSLDYWSVASAA